MISIFIKKYETLKTTTKIQFNNRFEPSPPVHVWCLFENGLLKIDEFGANRADNYGITKLIVRNIDQTNKPYTRFT